MFYAVYTNGVIDMKLTFEMLHHSSKHILFFAECHDDTSCRRYHFLNSHGESTYLTVNGGKLISIIYKNSITPRIIAFEIESPDRGVEIVDLYEEQGFYFPPLTISASLIRHLNEVGLRAFLGLE